MIKNKFNNISLFLFLLASHEVVANNTQIGRYLSVENEVSIEQSDPLLQLIQVKFPPNVETIKDAIDHVLRSTGFALVSSGKIKKELAVTLSKKLPYIHRELGPLPLKDVLVVLVGKSFILVEDPINREINFILNKSFIKNILKA